MRLGTLSQLLHIETKKTPSCRFSNREPPPTYLLYQKTLPSGTTALLHLPYTLPQLLIQDAQLKNSVRSPPTVARPTSHSYPAFCSPFSCAITCLPPKSDTQGPLVGYLKLHHMLDADDSTLVDIPDLPPLMMDQSFFMSVSAIRSFFQTVTRVSFYRFPHNQLDHCNAKTPQCRHL